jgi:hypothetical protein
MMPSPMMPTVRSVTLPPTCWLLANNQLAQRFSANRGSRIIGGGSRSGSNPNSS